MNLTKMERCLPSVSLVAVFVFIFEIENDENKTASNHPNF